MTEHEPTNIKVASKRIIPRRSVITFSCAIEILRKRYFLSHPTKSTGKSKIGSFKNTQIKNGRPLYISKHKSDHLQNSECIMMGVEGQKVDYSKVEAT